MPSGKAQVIFFSILFCTAGVLADNENLFKLALGAKTQNVLARRGATLYGSFQITPIIYVGFFDERIQIFGTSLELVEFLKAEILRARTKVASFSDDPFFVTGDAKGIRNSRDSTFEWTSTLEWFFPDHKRNWGEIDLRYSKDLKAHSGDYVEASARLSLGKFFGEGFIPTLQPQVFVTVGYGGSQHNQYFYGSNADSPGFNNVEVGLLVLLPGKYDSAYPAVTLSRYEILGAKNRAGTLVSDKVSGIYAQLTIAFGVL